MKKFRKEWYSVGTPQQNEKLNQYVNVTSPDENCSNMIIGGGEKIYCDFKK